ncbi:helix-hairpin-helix domain-containing protein [Pseudomonas fulva]|nr:helix-hairpin-helix domain-containing protein [Pseudomonas fulva]MBF8780878.1 helix-hairpin-helix domain-containing protein [Pseudomonas fulva]
MRKTFLSTLLLPLVASLSLSVGAAPKAEPVAQAATVEQAIQAQIDINKADASALQGHLLGIGKAKAEAIVAYREANGPFATVDELLEVKGIGSALLERNREKLRVE